MKRITNIENVTILLSGLGEGKTKREREKNTVSGMLREALGDEAVLLHDNEGAPYIEGSDLHISISHSRTSVAIALSKEKVIGIDIEDISERVMRVREKFMDKDDLEVLDYFVDEAKLKICTFCWCAKEAVFKAEGETAGLMGENIHLNTLDIALGRDTIASTARHSYNLYQIEAGEGECCVLAIQRERVRYDVKTMILMARREHKRLFALLLDPEKTQKEQLEALSTMARPALPDLILVGGSTRRAIDELDEYIYELKDCFPRVPIVMFPGNTQQVSAAADAILFLSLISGREAESLIGAQVKAAPYLKKIGLPTLPLGYILVDGGKQSSTERVTHTRAIPQSDTEQIVSTAIAGEMLGMTNIYLEAGSGAAKPVSEEVIRAVRSRSDAALFVGGGICTREQMEKAYEAGADIVVIGNYIEQHPESLRDFCNDKG